VSVHVLGIDTNPYWSDPDQHALIADLDSDLIRIHNIGGLAVKENNPPHTGVDMTPAKQFSRAVLHLSDDGPDPCPRFVASWLRTPYKEHKINNEPTF
jgi:hypothetical protein